MKRFLQLTSLVLATLTFVACNPNPPEKKSSQAIKVLDRSNADSFYGYAELSVPAGVTTVYLENYSGVDAQGHKKNLTITPIKVNPVVEAPANGKDVEPFGKVRLLFQAPAQTMVAVYYVAGDGAAEYAPSPERRSIAHAPMAISAEDDSVTAEVYALNDFPVDQITYGEFGKTSYVQVQWNFAWYNNESTNWQNTKSYPKDVVLYDAEHNHTLRYKFAYDGTGNGPAYFLDDAYEVKDYTVVGEKYHYCSGCSNCAKCMPWGCSCGCGSVNSAFVPNGDLTGGAEPELPEVPTLSPGITVVNLPEPAPYVTSDQEQTFYHSSGVVMFEDSWPMVNVGGVYDLDFDDVVVDYDIEAKTVADELLETEGWREQVKVVLHLRAVGSGNPYRVGVRLEGFNTNNVDHIDTYYTLDSYQNPHGELPAFTVNTLQNMSNHYENDPLNPIVEMAHLHVMNQARAGQGADAEYDYVNGSFTNHTVFNLTYGFKGGPDESQYDPELATDPTLPTPFEKIQNQKFYNVIPGYINVAGGLFTMTVIYHMKARAEMTPTEREAVKQNMIETVMNTTKQNFYIIADNNYTPVGLKGYDPVFLHPQSQSAYNNKFQQGVENGWLNPSTPYAGTNGAVWGFKCPTLTRHIWNKMYFSQAYPHYTNWVESGGAADADWYHHDVNEKYVVCWW